MELNALIAENASELPSRGRKPLLDSAALHAMYKWHYDATMNQNAPSWDKFKEQLEERAAQCKDSAEKINVSNRTVKKYICLLDANTKRAIGRNKYRSRALADIRNAEVIRLLDLL